MLQQLIYRNQFEIRGEYLFHGKLNISSSRSVSSCLFGNVRKPVARVVIHAARLERVKIAAQAAPCAIVTSRNVIVTER